MKRLGSSDSLGALMDICPTTTEHQLHNNNNQGNNNHVYTRDFQTMLEGLDEEGCVEESSHMREKKRRLSVEQVKALEKYFEVENKLEPERKVKLAQELGLQPRQVAVWFQNRRARWKTKQLERDYGVLKASYDSLKHNYDTLKQDNESLLKEIRDLKAKMHQDNSESRVVVKEEAMVSENEKQTDLANNCSDKCDETAVMNFESFDSNNNGVMGVSIFLDFKDGSSDSDSSAILNNEDNINNNNNNINSPKGVNSSSSGGVLQNQSPNHFFISNGGTTSSSSPSTSKNGCFQILEDAAAHKAYQPQFVKIEEHNFFSGHEDSCTTFFADDQAPTLHWYNPDEWNCS